MTTPREGESSVKYEVVNRVNLMDEATIKERPLLAQVR